MIPARFGSQRLKYKNLALIKNKALIEYSIENAKKSKIFNEIYVNSDSNVFEYFSIKHQIFFYLRKKRLGTSNTRSDDVIYDFLVNNNLENGILVWLNPIAPLMNEKLLNEVIKKYISKKLSSAITSNTRKVHTIYKSKALNYKKDEKFAKTQDLVPVETFNYAVMMWDIKKFLKNYKKYKHCFFINKFESINIPEHNSLIVKTNYDLKIIEKFMDFPTTKNLKVKYHRKLKNI
tara:strand:- start:196 stop:897 length:702 start_codon:yes stop_codon:yes gene_type:complete